VAKGARAEVDYLAAFKEFINLQLKGGSEYKALCPFHSDKDPSLHVNVEKGVYHCKGCGASGNLVSFVARLKGISIGKARKLYPQITGPDNLIHPQTVEDHHQTLMSNRAVLKHLTEMRGIPVDWIRSLRLGLHEDRIAIPIYTDGWWIVDIKYHAIEPGVQPKDLHAASYGASYCYPMHLDNDHSKPAVISEGELDAIVLRTLGFQAYTSTSGAQSIHKSTDLVDAVLQHPEIFICLDVDRVGREAAKRLKKRIKGPATYLVALPLDPQVYPVGDVTDYFVREGYKQQDFENLLTESRAATVEDEEVEEPVYDTVVGQASRAQYWGKHVRFKAMVIAKGIHPFLVPRKASITCAQGHKLCGACPVVDDPFIEIEATDDRITEFVGASRASTGKILRSLKQVPSNCRYCIATVLEVMNVQEVIVTGTFQSIVTTEEIDVTRRCLYLGHDVLSNNIYSMDAKVVSDPKTNEVLYVITHLEPDTDGILDVEVTDEDKVAIELFKPKEETADGIHEKLGEIYADLSTNVTRIFGREDLHAIIDLGYHSTLAFSWGDQLDKLYKGQTEMLIIGDSGQGKTEVLESIRNHYGRGEKLDCKSATYAGLIGGLDDLGNRRYMVWGRIPQNDLGAVILDEVKGMHTELIAQLTDVRSSGLAVVTRVGGARRASARVRYFWVSNPRSKMRVAEYGYGVSSVVDLIGSQEDVRRFDAAMVVATGEVPQAFIDDAIKNPPQIEHRYTRDACRRLLRVTWSRTHNIIPKEIKDYIVDRASELSGQFSVDIPLLEPADARLKIARISLAVAARVGSFTEDFSSVALATHHVDVAVDILLRLYTNENFAFDKWSEERKKALSSTKDDDQAVIDDLKTLTAPEDFISVVMVSNFIPAGTLESATGLEFRDAKEFIGALIAKQYITQFKNAYRKTPKLITLLRRIQQDLTVLEKDDEEGEF